MQSQKTLMSANNLSQPRLLRCPLFSEKKVLAKKVWSFLGGISSLSFVFEALLIPHQVINLNSTRPAKGSMEALLFHALSEENGKKRKRNAKMPA